MTPEGSDLESEQDPETFPREYVEKLRTENGKYRQRASEADSLANRLHTELVRATGKLADPTDLPFDAEHLEDTDKLSVAINELLETKPHLATRRHPVTSVRASVVRPPDRSRYSGCSKNEPERATLNPVRAWCPHD